MENSKPTNLVKEGKRDLPEDKNFKQKGEKRSGKKDSGRKPYRKDGEKKSYGGNDFAFWNKYPELMNIATRFPWMHIAGTPLSGDSINVNLPNVAVQSFYPVPGIQKSATSPLNLAFRKLYLDMHRKYRGIGTYQASDIAITILCIESVLQLIVEAERVYGIMNNVPVKTRIQPYGLLAALGYSGTFITSVAQNLADFRYGINRLVDFAKRLPLPKGMSFCANHISLNGFVYADSKDERADLLMFQCMAFFEYATTGDTDCINSSGTAVLKSFNRSAFGSYNGLLSYIETRLTKLLSDSDILRITSDFIACYGEENMQVLMPLPEDYKIAPIYDESILLKWHNSERSLPPNSYVAVSANTTMLAAGQFAVYQENDVIISWPVETNTTNTSWQSVNFAAAGLSGQRVCVSTTDIRLVENVAHIVDGWESEPSDASCCESVLWKLDRIPWTGTIGGTNYYCNLFTEIGTEIMGPLAVCSVINSAVSATYTSNTITERTSVMSGNVYFYLSLEHFDWHPFSLFLPIANNAYSGTVSVIAGDTDNVSAITRDVISKIHDAALLSAFAVDIVAKG